MNKPPGDMDEPIQTARDSVKDVLKGFFEIFSYYLQPQEPETYNSELKFTLKLETIFLNNPDCRQSILDCGGFETLPGGTSPLLSGILDCGCSKR